MATISRAAVLSALQAEMDADNVGFFLGAGMSVPAGFVDWRELMREIADEIGLSVDKETDLIAIAQYHQNTRKSRHKINTALITEFTKTATITENHRIIASLPVSTIWTTNYDHLIEDAFREAHKSVDVKRSQVDLATTRPRAAATIYKIHGDVDQPDEAVLTKDDFAAFETKRGLFSTQLQGHLVAKSFLFLGYSFNDPNMDHLLVRIRAALHNNKRDHYCVMREVVDDGNTPPADLDYRRRWLQLRIEDLQNYGIQTLLVKEYSEVTDLLRELRRRAMRKNVFVSGSAADYSPFTEGLIEDLSRALGSALIDADCNLISGMGLGIGGAVTIGALERLYASPASQLDERTILRPFPQVAPATGTLAEIWERYRQEMISKAGFAVFLVGNKKDANGNVVDAPGVVREFEIAVEHGVYPIPVGATGHVALKLSQRVLSDLPTYYPRHTEAVRAALTCLADTNETPDAWLKAIVKIIRTMTKK